METHELIDGGLYLVEGRPVRFSVVHHGFRTVDGGEVSGFPTLTQRGHNLVCHLGKKGPDGFMHFRNVPIKPIPVTPEILGLNGFRYEKDYGQFMRSILGDYARDREPVVCIGWNPKGKMCKWDMSNGDHRACYGSEALSVHQLQAALLTCGLEDLAKNFSVTEN